jgi:hypothetical protein
VALRQRFLRADGSWATALGDSLSLNNGGTIPADVKFVDIPAPNGNITVTLPDIGSVPNGWEIDIYSNADASNTVTLETVGPGQIIIYADGGYAGFLAIDTPFFITVIKRATAWFPLSRYSADRTPSTIPAPVRGLIV